ncbi:hypothetical protein QTQ03_29535 [Micromonospora sp. WMMA1363]|uniref:hypothetical protein n=1 Tax=Micromonospora sp. WMMA1363 TaxID=3053985 RepID=UPI00259CB3E5|nr:hypothetical protein [Micromonospora sp. WMMA1363]MDM4723519.1 hypothetical protein [Micromonospora sp. WMMA1363]
MANPNPVPPLKDIVDGCIEHLMSTDKYQEDQSPNITLAATVANELVISMVNGMSGKHWYAKEAKKYLNEEERDETLYAAQKFNGPSNHAEMCILCVCHDDNDPISYIRCTANNCDACHETLRWAGVTTQNGKNGNQGGGKSQTGWVHPIFPLSIGTQIFSDVPWADQVEALKDEVHDVVNYQSGANLTLPGGNSKKDTTISQDKLKVLFGTPGSSSQEVTQANEDDE